MGRIIVHLHGKPKQASYSALIEMYADRLKGRNIKIKTHSDKVSSPDYQNKLMDNKLLTIRAAENVVRILPPLTVKKNEINLALKIIRKVCKEY